MLKIIIIIVAYTLNNFTTHYHNSIVDDGKLYNFKKKINFLFFENNNYSFSQCGN